MTWDEINRKRLPFIRMGDRLFKGMYNEIKKQMAAVIKDRQTPEQITEAIRSFTIDEGIVLAAYERFYTRTGLYFAKDTIKSSHKLIEHKDINSDFTEDIWLKQLLEYVRTHSGRNISSVIKTHYKDIEAIAKQAVELGIDEGWGMDKIARAIVKRQGEIDTWKSLRIARTEVVSASNEGVNIGADQLVGKKTKVWISTFDQRSRTDHMEMDGVKVPYNENFTTPKGNVMKYPGDQECGDASDTINCRCGYEVIVEPEIY